MGRFFLLFFITLLSFSIVFGVGYFLFVPKVSIPMMEDPLQPLGDMEPAFEEDMPEAGEIEDPGEAPDFN